MESLRESFCKRIRITNVNEREKLLDLQKKYEKDLISKEDMTDEQIIKLKKLYEEQILKLRSDFIEYREKAIKLRRKLFA